MDDESFIAWLMRYLRRGGCTTNHASTQKRYFGTRRLYHKPCKHTKVILWDAAAAPQTMQAHKSDTLGRGGCTTNHVSTQKRYFRARELHYQQCKPLKEMQRGADATRRAIH